MSFEDFIRKHWVIENNSSTKWKDTGQLIGDGSFELLFIEGSSQQTDSLGRVEIVHSGIYIGGQINVPMNIQLAPETKVHSIKLEPWVMSLISDFNFKAALNKTIPLQEVCPSLHAKLLKFDINHQYAAIRQVLLDFFEKQAQQSKDWKIIKFCCELLSDPDLDFKTAKEKYTQALQLSARSIEQKFNVALGLSPQQFSNSIKLRLASEKIQHTDDRINLTDVAYELGYYDQAHFNRIFKKHWGFPPKQMQKQDVFITDSKEPFRYYTIF